MAMVTPEVRVDGQSSEPGRPYGIITVDGPDPYEYDDGIAVTKIPGEAGLYQVNVFAADTSPLYADDGIVTRVIERGESRYLNPLTSLRSYEPMLPESLVRDYEFKEGMTRSALVISFTVGRNQPPDNVQVGFGYVEVIRNYVTQQFNRKCLGHNSLNRFMHAAGLILHHMYYGGEIDSQTANQRARSLARGGSSVNTPFMISSNFLVGALVQQHQLPHALFRVHDERDAVQIGRRNWSAIARFSRTPGPHDGLGISVYTRVTSALRRAEDFVMHGLLRAYVEGRPFDSRDEQITDQTIERLNRRIDAKVRHGTLEPRDDDHWIEESQATTELTT